MSTEDNSWRTPTFRQSMIAKIDEAIKNLGKPIHKSACDMENHVFQKAKTKEEYLNYIARLLLHVSQIGKTATNPGQNVQGMQDPINALQNLARQGTGNERNMGMGPGHGPIVQQQPPGNPQIMQGMNQRPGQPMNIQGMPNKVPVMGMMPGQGPPMNVNHMGQMPGMQANPMMAQMNQINQGNLQQQMGPQGNQQHMGGAPINAPQMGAAQNPMPNQMVNHQMGQMNVGMPPQQPNLPQQQHMNQMNPAQMAANQLQQQHHMQQKTVGMMNTGFAGPRNVAPAQFLRQSPSPSVPSPGGLAAPNPASNQMVASPLVPSPNPQHAMLATTQRSVGMVSSPSSSLNTPAGASVATPSPLQEEQGYQAYKEKIRKLSKYIEPLRNMILKLTKEGNIEKISKMKKLLEILTNPSSSTKLDVLNKCEIALEKMDLKKYENSVGPNQPVNFKEHHLFSPLLEVVSTVLQSPVANHTLHRTFGPCLEAYFGPDIKDLPPPLKKQKVEEQPSDIPEILQGEIARLDQRFKISLDPAQQNGSKSIQLVCWLDDKYLPCVPPISVVVPADYPNAPPRCILAGHEYATPFLSAVQSALDARFSKLPKRFSVSQLLDSWEISVRQASAPKPQQSSITTPTICATGIVTIATAATTVTTTAPINSNTSNVTSTAPLVPSVNLANIKTE